MSRTLIVGGGAIGLSVAYHLARRGERDVCLLERHQLTAGTSWHAAGIVGPLRASPAMTRLASYALELFPRLERETGMSTGYRRTGGYWLARRPERLDELHRIASLGVTQGLSPAVVEPAQVDLPLLDLGAHVGALHVPEDANVNPVDLCMAYARAARRGGVEIREGVEVDRLSVREGRARGVVLADGRELEAETVVLCAGAWSRRLAATAGVALPLQAVEHMYIVTEPMADLPDPFPVLRDLDSGIYIKGDAGRLVIGGFEPNAKCWDAAGPTGDTPFLELPEDWEQFEPFMHAALALVPKLAQVGVQRFMNGPESFSADTRALVGESCEVDRLFVAAGMNSVGVMSSAGVGRALADWVVDGRPREDLWEVDCARVDPASSAPEHLRERMREAVADAFALHWPYKQPAAGRGLRRSALHQHWAGQGAVFGLTAGWERGLWYARNSAERELPYSVGAQPWWPIAAREAARMQGGAVLLDLSPFGKFRVSGAAAPAGLDALSSASLDRPTGRAIYTQLLNERGGIEMDVTVCRCGEDRFDITSGAATRTRDLAWLRRNLPADCTIEDRTEFTCVIGVMGSESRSILQALSERWPTLAYGEAGEALLAGVRCWLTRVSFVGALGWEVSVPVDDAARVFDALVAAGAGPMGHYALEGCRLEKGFKHWGHELGPELTPLQAGLGFCVDWERPFRGREVLQQQREQGLGQRIVLLRVDGEPLLLHDEPVYEGGRVVGLTTSGGRGPRTGLNLALALIEVAPGETLAHSGTRELEVEVAGRRFAARVLPRPPYDPSGQEMRA